MGGLDVNLARPVKATEIVGTAASINVVSVAISATPTVASSSPANPISSGPIMREGFVTYTEAIVGAPSR
jgi:hypothetical protein